MKGYKGAIISLFDQTGYMVEPWARDGWLCLCVDLEGRAGQDFGEGRIEYLGHDLRDLDGAERMLRGIIQNLPVRFVFGFPPCTDLASVGAPAFKAKAAEDPDFQEKAAKLFDHVEILAGRFGAGYVIENPRGVLPRLRRRWDYSFDPCNFGGYLPEGDRHPKWPRIIPARDAYRKETCIWASKDFVFPEMKCVPLAHRDGKSMAPQRTQLGGTSNRTKNIRSATPRGFALAVWMANSGPWPGKGE